jgi:hypothetical protein
MTSAGFPHSETLGSQLVCQLPEDYRRLQRPSSAPSAKASTNVPLKTSGNTTITETKMTTKQQPQAKDPWSIRFTIAILENFKDARVHYAVLKQRTNPPGKPVTPHPTTGPVQGPASVSGYDTNLVTRTRSRNTQPCSLPKEWAGRLSQDPTVCLANPHHPVDRVPTRDKHRRTSSQPGQGDSSSMFHP